MLSTWQANLLETADIKGAALRPSDEDLKLLTQSYASQRSRARAKLESLGAAPSVPTINVSLKSSLTHTHTHTHTQ